MKKFLLLTLVVLGLVLGTFWFFHRSPQVIKNYPSSGKTIVMLGDSLTEGIGASPGRALPVLISEKIGEPVINMGVSGDTTKDALRRLNAVLVEDPKVVIVLLGGNDYLQKIPIGETFQNLDSIISKLQDAGAVVILVGIQGGILSDPFAGRLEKLARERQTGFVPNIFSGVIGNSKYMADEVHPNNAGYEIIAGKIAPEVKRVMQ